MSAKFVLKKGSTGKFRFNLLAGNGQVVATSEAYESKRAALGGIESVKKNAPEAEVDDQTSGATKQRSGAKKSTSTRESGDRDAKATGDKATLSRSDRQGDERKEERSRDDSGDEEHREEVGTNLGPCHYCGENTPATAMASRDDGTGWIAVCDEHTDKASKDGFTPGEY